MTRPGFPFANSALAQFLDRRIDELKGVRSQREIAAMAGFERPNIISMFKRGETKIPLDRLVALSRALDADPVHLFRLAMIDMWPELAPVIDEIFGRQLATQNEYSILLSRWRSATDNTDPAPNAHIEAAVDRMLREVGRK